MFIFEAYDFLMKSAEIKKCHGRANRLVCENGPMEEHFSAQNVKRMLDSNGGVGENSCWRVWV